MFAKHLGSPDHVSGTTANVTRRTSHLWLKEKDRGERHFARSSKRKKRRGDRPPLGEGGRNIFGKR